MTLLAIAATVFAIAGQGADGITSFLAKGKEANVFMRWATRPPWLIIPVKFAMGVILSGMLWILQEDHMLTAFMGAFIGVAGFIPAYFNWQHIKQERNIG
jgi:hypothetical protein